MDGEAASFLSVKSINPAPDTLFKLICRLRALTLVLLPIQVKTETLDDPTSSVITSQVIAAYNAAAGDFVEALPYCLLRARAEFMYDANCNPADYGENHSRAIACEILARRIVHLVAPDRLNSVMSTRYRHLRLDGEMSEMSNALELAIDSHCTIFLSSSEAQGVVLRLWDGELIQRNNRDHGVDFISYEETRDDGFWAHLDPSRLSVPRYQNFFRIVVWIFFLVVYSQAVREPLERVSTKKSGMDGWEYALYIMVLAFTFEDTTRFYKLLRFVSWRAVSFWNAVSGITDCLFIAAFVLRMVDLWQYNPEKNNYRLASFQVLSCASPLIWMKLITVFDGYKYVGTMTICVARMLRESSIFFALLSVLGLGFGQGLYALDAADGKTEDGSVIVNVLVQSLLGSSDFDKFSTSAAGLILYYLWNVVTAVILLNVLISLFSSAYSDVVDDAEAEYLVFFAGKTVGMIRAPDSYVYPAPFNLIELVFVAPFELLPKMSLSPNAYNQLNRYVMGFFFFIPLSCIAIYESSIQRPKNGWMKNWFMNRDQGDSEADVERPEHRNPEVGGKDAEDGLAISKVPFEELVKVFPNLHQSSAGTILKEIGELREIMRMLSTRMEQLADKVSKG